MTNIKFHTPIDENVNIAIYNMLGEHVRELTDHFFKAGTHELVFNGNELSQGIYFLKMTTEGFTETKNMNILQ
ncbi:MAG: hypothetical protein CMP50_00620 [Flavobacteriales bacterium]|nr:hypothetical protein [Flavobacteriales bacterium]